MSKHPALTAFAANIARAHSEPPDPRHLATIEDELVERLYCLRKLQRELHKATAAPQEELPSPRLPSQRDASTLELRRLAVERPVTRVCARVPTPEDLIALGGGFDWRLSWERLEAAPDASVRNLRDGWLLFSYGGPGEILSRALKHYPAAVIALALRSRDPQPNEAAALTYRYRESARAKRRDQEALVSAIRSLEPSGIVHKVIEPLRLELAAVTSQAERLEALDKFEMARASNAPAQASLSEALEKVATNEIALERERLWWPLAEGLGDLAGADRWTDDDLAELIMTGAGAPDGWLVPIEGWGFPLCPIDCSRGKKKIAASLRTERARARRRATV